MRINPREASVSLAQRVLDLRTAAGLSQSQVGRLMQRAGFESWNQVVVSRTEKGGRELSLLEGVALAGALGTTLGGLLGSDGEASDRESGLWYAIDILSRELRGEAASPRAVATAPSSPTAAVQPASGASTLLTLNEAAEFLGKSPAMLRWMRHNGGGPRSAKLGGRVVYRKQDLTDWINKAFEEES